MKIGAIGYFSLEILQLSINAAVNISVPKARRSDLVDNLAFGAVMDL